MLLMFPIIIALAIVVFAIVALWKVFEKAGQPGWASIVPFYNFYIMLKIVGRPGWWLALMFIPIANFVIYIMVVIDLAKAFGKGGGFAALLILVPFVGYPMLAWGDAVYQGPVADPNFAAGAYRDYLQPGYPQPGYPPQGYPQQGWMQPAYPPQPQTPYPPQPYQQQPQQQQPYQQQPQQQQPYQQPYPQRPYQQQPPYPQQQNPQQQNPQQQNPQQQQPYPQQPGWPAQYPPGQRPPGQ